MIKNVVFSSMLFACGIVAGVGLDRIAASESPAAQSSKAGSAGSVSPFARLQSGSATASLDAVQIRAMLREELGAALTSALANSSGDARYAEQPSVAAPVVMASAQQQEDALEAANAIIAGGEWGDIERIGFHQQLAQLDPVQREQAMQNLVQAIDNGSLKMLDGASL